jgi:archaellum component FlaF (FlaF/FlaG flagellin family)
MGLSVSAAASIIFIASVIAFSTVTGAIFAMEHDLQEAKAVSDEIALETARTHLSLTTVDRANGSISIVNDGCSVLDPRDIWLLINGTLIDPSGFSYSIGNMTDTTFFNPGETMEMFVGTDLIDARICMMTTSGFRMAVG